MQDCNPEMGNKKEPSAQLTPKGSIQKLSNKVYHIIKPKGKNIMIELKITVTNATELTKEVTDLYEKVVGEPMAKVYHGAKAGEVKKETKVTKKAEPKTEDAPKQEAKAEALKEEPKQEELAVDVPSVEDVRAAVKNACSTKEDKQELKAFLESIKLDKVSNANGGQRMAIMDWVNKRG